MKKSTKVLIAIPSTIAGLFLLVLVAISVVSQILLSPRVSEKVIREYAPQYYAGSFSMGRASISVFRHFPRLTVDIDSLDLTYPAVWFEADACERVDTLASFRKFSASLNTLSLMRGMLQLNHIELEHPRVFIRHYDEGRFNWSIIRLDTGQQDKKVKTSSGEIYIPHFVFNRMHLGGDPLIEYSDASQQIYATLRLEEYVFDGSLNTGAFQRSTFRTNIDSLVVEGRSKGDTLRYRMDLNLVGKKGKMDVQLRTKTLVATENVGRAMVPFNLDGNVDAFNRWDGVLCLDMRNVDVNVAAIGMQADMKLVLDKKIGMNGNLHLSGVDVQHVLDAYINRITDKTWGLHTNMIVSADVRVDGDYDPATGAMPDLSAVVNIPRAYLYHDEFNYRPEIELDTKVTSTSVSGVEAVLTKCNIFAPGLKMTVKGTMSDMTSQNPGVDLDCRMNACLDSLGKATDEKFEIRVGGRLDLKARGKFNLSNIRKYNFANADVDLDIKIADALFASRPDDMVARVGDIRLKAALMDDRFLEQAKIKDRSIGIRLDAGNVKFRYANTLKAAVSGLSAFFLNASDRVDFADTLRFHPLRASLDVTGASGTMNDTISFSIKSSKSSLRQLPSRENARIPIIDIQSENNSLSMDMGDLSAALNSLKLNASMRMSGVFNRRRLITRLDSLNRLHPEMMPDSMWRFLVQNPHAPKLPHFMAGSDAARAADAAKKATHPMLWNYQKWNVDGKVSLEGAKASTACLPIAGVLDGFEAAFSNDVVQIDRLDAGAGSSRLRVDGAVSGIREAILNSAPFKINVAVDCDTLALTEIINSLPHTVAQPQPKLARGEKKAKTQVDTKKVIRPDLVMVPDKIDALLTVRTKGVSLGEMYVSSLSTDVAVRDRCVQLMGTKARTALGGLDVEAYYHTPEKDRANLGFDMDLRKLSVGEVINLVPGIDSLAAIMKSFNGTVNCQTAATLALDSKMNLVPGTINGVLRFTADSLHFSENKKVTAIARLLWVKNASHATIEHLNVEAMLHDGEVEIFPFGLKLENWELALAGVQHLDQSMDYHISLIRNPFGLKFGMNLTGPDFDHIKFKLGKSRYRSLDQIPSFSDEVDAERASLVARIRSIFEYGSENADRNHRELDAIRKARSEKDYSRSVAVEPLDELSDADKAVVEQLNSR